MIQKISLIALLAVLPLVAAVETNLKDISVSEPDLTVAVDGSVQLLCKRITELYKEHGYPCSDEHVARLVNAKEELDYETVLYALDSLLHDQRSIDMGAEAQDLKQLLAQNYNKLLEEYYQLAVQTTRGIKVKFFTRVNTRDLSVTGGLILGKLNGVLQSIPGGDVTAGPVESANIADGAVGTTQLANGAVTNAKIANSTILPTKFSFYPVIANIAEGAVLNVYRGTVQMDGTIDKGAGFSVSHLGTGIYMVTFTSTTYSNSYDVLIQFSGNNQFATSIDTSNLGYFTFLVKDSAGTLIDYGFSFFTIGS